MEKVTMRNRVNKTVVLVVQEYIPSDEYIDVFGQADTYIVKVPVEKYGVIHNVETILNYVYFIYSDVLQVFGWSDESIARFRADFIRRWTKERRSYQKNIGDWVTSVGVERAANLIVDIFKNGERDVVHLFCKLYGFELGKCPCKLDDVVEVVIHQGQFF